MIRVNHTILQKKSTYVSVVILSIIVIATSAYLSLTAPKAQAAPVVGFNPGAIIDDGVFTNPATMDVAQIQAFLNSKVPVCDTAGSQNSEYGGGTRAQWGAAHNNPAPFVCLKDYVENGKSAARIISDTAIQYRINPQVFIVLLQKEQGLVTDTWPLNIQYRSATGYGCPDTAACDSKYYGLTNQLQWSGKMFRSIMDASPSWYTPYVLGNNTIKWSPDNNCGSSVVNIQNRATQALYNYTPYRPNQAALDAGYGRGDNCSAHGNRNFYLYFTDWFGSVRAVNGSITISHALTTSTSTVKAGDTINAWFEVANSANTPIDVGGLGVCGRLNGAYYDFGFSHRNTIAANGKLIISYSRMVDNSGTLNLFICSYNEALGGWASAQYPYNTSPILARSLTLGVGDNPLVSTGVTLSPVSPSVGQSVTATMTLQNTSNGPVNIGSLVVAGRTGQGGNVDFPIVNDVVVPAGGSYTYSQSRVLNQYGAYSFYLANWAGAWTTAYPKSASGSVPRAITTHVQDNPLLTTNISLSPASPTVGQSVTANVTMHNAGDTPINIGSLVIAGRSPQGGNVDFPLVNDVIIPAGGDYTYSRSRVFTQTGNHSFYVANWNGIWSTTYPKSAGGTVRTLSVNVN